MGSGLRGMVPQAKKCSGGQKFKSMWKLIQGPSLRALKGSTVLLTPQILVAKTIKQLITICIILLINL